MRRIWIFVYTGMGLDLFRRGYKIPRTLMVFLKCFPFVSFRLSTPISNTEVFCTVYPWNYFAVDYNWSWIFLYFYGRRESPLIYFRLFVKDAIFLITR